MNLKQKIEEWERDREGIVRVMSVEMKYGESFLDMYNQAMQALKEAAEIMDREGELDSVNWLKKWGFEECLKNSKK